MIPRLLAIDLADRTSLQRTQEWFSRTDPTVFITIGSLLGLIVLALLVAGLWQRIQDWRIEPTQRQPMALFRRLQRQIGVPWLDRWHLWRLARRLDLPHPAALLISEMFFDRCVDQHCGADAPEQKARFQAIRRHLFGAGNTSSVIPAGSAAAGEKPLR